MTITIYLWRIRERGKRLAQKQRMIERFDRRGRQRGATPASLPSKKTVVGLWDGIGAGSAAGAIVCLAMGWDVVGLVASVLTLVWAISVKLRDGERQSPVQGIERKKDDQESEP
jgi:hypothetical protein